MSITLYSHAAETAAEASPTDNTESTSTSNDNVKRSLLSPQKNRISGLINQLSQNSAHEINTLSFNEESFLSLFRDASSGDPQGCIILLHGDNEHPDWPSVISPIRTKLNANSWCTLSVEIPDVYPKESLTIIDNQPAEPTENETATIILPNEEVIFGRIDVAIEFLRTQEFSTFILLGHKTGASYALKYIADKEVEDGALVMIAPISPNRISSFDISQTIRQVKVPILDYYFDVSTKETRFAQERQSMANKREDKNLAYQQIKALPDQRYQEAGEKRLTQRVWGFLKQNTLQKLQQRPLPSIRKGLFHETEFEIN